MQLVFHNPSFSFQLLRIIGQTYYGGADIGECLSTAYQIKEGDIESWYNEWLKTANRVYKYAEDCMSKGHKISSREAYLRATNYYQNGAAFYLDTNPSDPRITPTWEKGVESFRKAIGLFSDKVETIEIPYDGTILPGYFFNVSGKKYGNSNNDDNSNQKQVEKELRDYMRVEPVPFSTEHKPLLYHAKFLLENKYVHILPSMDKLIISLRTAYAKDGTLDKEATSHNDILDAFPLCLRPYKEKTPDY